MASKDEKELIMCGIIGISSNQVVSSDIIKSLSKLEYRGYDSAGLAVLVRAILLNEKLRASLVI